MAWRITTRFRERIAGYEVADSVAVDADAVETGLCTACSASAWLS